VKKPPWFDTVVESIWRTSAPAVNRGRPADGEPGYRIALRYWSMYAIGMTPAQIVPEIQVENPSQSAANIGRIARRYKRKSLRAIDLTLVSDDEMRAIRKRLKKHQE
jgi:hypothetical protein